MGNEEDRFALRCQVFHDLQQFLDLRRRQNRGRLIKDQNLIIPVQHFQNFGALLHTHRDILHLGIGVDGQAVFFRNGHHV